MLHKYIQKIIRSLPKDKLSSKDTLTSKGEINLNLEQTYQEDKIENINSTNSLTSRKEIFSLFPGKTGLSKRHSLFKGRNSNDNKQPFSSDILEAKNKRINELDNKLKNISGMLYDLALKIKEALKLEDVYFIFIIANFSISFLLILAI